MWGPFDIQRLAECTNYLSKVKSGHQQQVRHIVTGGVKKNTGVKEWQKEHSGNNGNRKGDEEDLVVTGSVGNGQMNEMDHEFVEY